MTYLTRKEVKNYLKIKDDRTIKALINEGLPAIQVGKSIRFSKEAIDDFMKEHEVITTNK